MLVHTRSPYSSCVVASCMYLLQAHDQSKRGETYWQACPGRACDGSHQRCNHALVHRLRRAPRVQQTLRHPASQSQPGRPPSAVLRAKGGHRTFGRITQLIQIPPCNNLPSLPKRSGLSMTRRQMGLCQRAPQTAVPTEACVTLAIAVLQGHGKCARACSRLVRFSGSRFRGRLQRAGAGFKVLGLGAPAASGCGSRCRAGASAAGPRAWPAR